MAPKQNKKNVALVDVWVCVFQKFYSFILFYDDVMDKARFFFILVFVRFLGCRCCCRSRHLCYVSIAFIQQQRRRFCVHDSMLKHLSISLNFIEKKNKIKIMKWPSSRLLMEHFFLFSVFVSIWFTRSEKIALNTKLNLSNG